MLRVLGSVSMPSHGTWAGLGTVNAKPVAHVPACVIEVCCLIIRLSAHTGYTYSMTLLPSLSLSTLSYLVGPHLPHH